MQTSLRKKYASNTFLFGLFLLAASLPYSKVTISIAEIILFASWLAEGELIGKVKRFLKNKTALILSSLFIMHAIGMIYTSDTHEGFLDLKQKVPLMLLPLLFSTMPLLSKPMLDRLLALFTLATVVATLISFAALLGIGPKKVTDAQGASLFISHIRFALLISMSVFILGYFISHTSSIPMQVCLGVIILWLIVFLIMMESAAGLVCTVTGGIVLIIQYIFQSNKIILKIALTSIFGMACFATIQLYRSASSEFDIKETPYNTELLQQTPSGNPYTHDTTNLQTENGYFVWRNLCEPELSAAWDKKSEIDYWGKDLRGNDIKYTLIRFLTSKGVQKDAAGIESLSPQELHAIEKGIPNVNYVGVFNPTARLQKILWEFDIYQKGGNPSGHSVVQRLEFWKAATGIIRENPIIGVGTGDMKQAFARQYEKMNSPLSKEWRLRSHNQFLAIGTAFGILGMILFLFTLAYPLFQNKKYNDYLYLMFFIIALLSMFSEDTLESQSGVTFFAFFNSLFLFLKPDQSQPPIA